MTAYEMRISDWSSDVCSSDLSSFVLLMSSLTMALAVASITRGDVHRNRVWLASTALLGAVFIGGQVYEFTTFYREGLGYTTNIFGSAFYTLTGFHGVHVTVGIRSEEHTSELQSLMRISYAVL